MMHLITAFLFIAAGAGLARDELPLERCIELGSRQNPALAKTALERDIDDAARLAAWGQFLPTVAVGYTIDQSSFYNPTYLNPDGTVSTFPRIDTLFTTFIDDSFYVRVDPESYREVEFPIPEGKRRSSGYYVRVEETLFDGGRRHWNLKNARLQEQLREHRTTDAKFFTRASVTRAYCLCIAAERRLELAARIVKQRRLQLELAEVRFQTGSVTRRDVLQADVDLGRSIADSLAASVELLTLTQELNQLVGLPIDTSYALAGLDAPFLPVWDADSLWEAAVILRSSVTIGELSAGIGENELKAMKSEYLPALTASLTHNRSEQSGAYVAFTLKPRNRFTSMGLTASWVLFDRFTRELRIQEAGIRHKQAAIDAAEAKRSVEKDVRAALNRLISLYHQSQVAAQNGRLAEETLDFEQERYRLGSASSIEVGAAQVSFMQAQSEQIRIETEFHIALGGLELAVGVELR